MKSSTTYKTRQRDAILCYLRGLDGAHVTATEIAAHFQQSGQPIGLATIYRSLDMLHETGEVRKYLLEGQSACYQYTTEAPDCEHFHLKCEKCGQLIHLECDYLAQIAQHLKQDHNFTLNAHKIVFYGLCDDCS